MSDPIRVEARDGRGKRCPFCHDSLSEATVRCDACGVECHAECRAQLGACPTLGCVCASPVKARVEALRAPELAGLRWFFLGKCLQGALTATLAAVIGGSVVAASVVGFGPGGLLGAIPLLPVLWLTIRDARRALAVRREVGSRPPRRCAWSSRS